MSVSDHSHILHLQQSTTGQQHVAQQFQYFHGFHIVVLSDDVLHLPEVWGREGQEVRSKWVILIIIDHWLSIMSKCNSSPPGPGLTRIRALSTFPFSSRVAISRRWFWFREFFLACSILDRFMASFSWTLSLLRLKPMVGVVVVCVVC